MALSDKTIDGIVEAYDGGKGDSIPDIASARGITAAAVKYHLKSRGVLAAPRAIMNPEKPLSQEPADQSDEDLGIATEEETVTVSKTDLQAMIEAAVRQQMQTASPGPTTKTSTESDFREFLDKFGHSIEVLQEQRPGYIKPLGADEIDSRAKGKADMFALLRQYKADNVWPEYLLSDEGNPFYGPSINGPVLYEAGQTIRTHIAPAECFQPLNEPAMQVYQAYKRWIGEVVPIEELIAQAAAAARGQAYDSAPEVAFESKVDAPEVQLVSTPIRDVGPKRVLGTLTPETSGKPMPRQAGVAPQPAGPIFVAEA